MSCHFPGNFKQLKNTVKTTVKDESKKINYFQEIGVEAVLTINYTFKEYYMFKYALLLTPIMYYVNCR